MIDNLTPDLAITSTGLAETHNATLITMISETISRVVLDIIVAISLVIKDLMKNQGEEPTSIFDVKLPLNEAYDKELTNTFDVKLPLNEAYDNDEYDFDGYLNEQKSSHYSTARDIQGRFKYSINDKPLTQDNVDLSKLDQDIIESSTFGDTIYNTILSALIADHGFNKDEAWKFDVSCQQILLMKVSSFLQKKFKTEEAINMTEIDFKINVNTNNRTVTISAFNQIATLIELYTDPAVVRYFNLSCSATIDHKDSTFKATISYSNPRLEA